MNPAMMTPYKPRTRLMYVVLSYIGSTLGLATTRTAPAYSASDVDIVSAHAARIADERRVERMTHARTLRRWASRMGVMQAAIRPVQRTRRPLLASDERYGLKLIRDAIVRERTADADKVAEQLARYSVSAERLADELNRAARAGYDAEPWKGLVPAREARYSERGRGSLASASAARVSVRDAHVTPSLLRQARTVGYANPAPGRGIADARDHATLLHAVLTDTRRASLTVLTPSPHGYRIAVRAADEYIIARETRRDAARIARGGIADVALHAQIGADVALADGTA